MIRMCLFALVMMPVLLLSAPVPALQPDEILDDPAMEERARELSKEVRCLVCQNQAIDDSNAELARDLRLLVRERLVAGDSDEEVLAFLVDRYGPFVLLEPPKTESTYLLWYGPAGLLTLAVAAIALMTWRRRRAEEPPRPLSAEERARVEALLGGDDDVEGGRR